ncbi:MAG: molybdenum cofactor biosynthesis protein B [Gammaproteobacteria bacterium]|nr:MAG: molybdenum cofactor biosynthesis protein B [Gammaproteobacteria bacterium]
MSRHQKKEFKALNIAVLTVSDSRTEDTDTSGKALVERLTGAGHTLAEKVILIDDPYIIRARVANWAIDEAIQVILITGGTGLTGRDVTPEAVRPLFDKEIVGFGELFRMVSYEEIGTSTIQSRALGGISNGTLIFCMPGSTGACKTSWDKILMEQLDVRHTPCNFVEVMPRLKER